MIRLFAIAAVIVVVVVAAALWVRASDEPPEQPASAMPPVHKSAAPSVTNTPGALDTAKTNAPTGDVETPRAPAPPAGSVASTDAPLAPPAPQAMHGFDGVSHTLKEEQEHIAAEIDRKHESALRSARARKLGELMVKTGMTQEQHDTLQSMLDAERTEIRAVLAKLPPGDTPSTQLRRQIASLREHTDEQAQTLLSPAQQAAYADMRKEEDRSGS